MIVEIVVSQDPPLLHPGAVEVLGEVRCEPRKIYSSHKRD